MLGVYLFEGVYGVLSCFLFLLVDGAFSKDIMLWYDKLETFEMSMFEGNEGWVWWREST